MTETMNRRAFNFQTVSQAHRDVIDDRYRDLRRPRKVRFYVNGDRYFKGKKLYITPHRYFNFNDLLNDLTGKLPSNLSLPYGVRQIFTPSSGRRVVDIEDLQDGHAYVCAGFEGYKPIKYGKAELEPWSVARHHQHDNLDNEQNYTQGPNYRPRMYGNAFHPGRFFQGKGIEGAQHHRRLPGAFGPASRNSYLAHTGESTVPLKPKVITIVRNGPKPRNNVKILLNRRSVQSFEQLMGDISEAFGPKWKTNKVRKLFTTRGREVQGVADFFRDDDVFIGVGNEPLTEHDVHEIIEEVYPDSPYAKNIMKDFERQKRKKLAQVKDPVKDIDADKRDSGFGEGSDGSNRDPDSEFVLYKGRPTEKGKRRNEYPRDLEVAMRLDKEKEKAAHEEKDRVRRQRMKMIDAERRAQEEESRKKRQVPDDGKVEDPFKKMKEQRDKEREEIRKRKDEERKKQEEDDKTRRDEERQRREKDKIDREQAEAAARERQAAAEKERAEREREKAERRAARDKEKEQKEQEAREKERELKEKVNAEKREKHHSEKQEKDVKETESDKHGKERGHGEKDDKVKEVVTEREDKNSEKNDKIIADNKEKDNKEAERRKKKTGKNRIVRKTKLERQISNDNHVLAKYELGRTLGDGNFAIVRLSKMKATGVEYAMKVIDKPKLKGKEHMVENEIEIMKDCNHPNIVKLYEEYETSDKIYLVMELVKGGDLFDAITQSVKFGEVDSAHMVKDLCSALFYLHSRIIVHRDLKPENLLVHRNKDMTISLKLADFGLAMDVKEAIYTVCGTPTYVAPEILSEIGYGLEVDMWAVGVITYILLCGFPPFRSPDRNQTELFEFIKAGEYEFLSPYWDNISSSAKDLIEHLLVVDKKRRYTAIDVLCHPWILCGGDVSGMDGARIEELKKTSRKELETQAALNLESYQKMKEKRALTG
ncbi:serine/threonine-protein kinase DCLK1-like isoform X2 [Dreissena polymorpha]|uniref:serine/threonine-protein kinase DCLK1-like isoform X2 n=1 Tax=Dreissena polymorpha TaxID=45954 RepID=UPI0022645613|nr:serine/threonine-protein kinase DCLK1-like isoform X2 [Dreissena polymorpha]